MNSEAPADCRRPPPPGFTPVPSSTAFGGLIGPFYEDLSVDEGVVRGFYVDGRHANSGGVLHGGMLMSFADILLGQAAWNAAGGPVVTMRMISDFLAPARPGDWVRGEARLSGRQGRSLFIEGLITVRDRPILSTEAIFQKIDRR